MPDAPFSLLSIRGEDDAADDEDRAVMRFGGLDLNQWSGIILGDVGDAPDEK